jgi:hypothetical protein
MEIEIWSTIEGFEGLYEISTLGNVKSLARVTSQKHILKESFLKPHFDKDGYVIVELNKNGKGYGVRVHRLVATAFIPNIMQYPMVNHINGIKNDNRVENLEWCNHSMNVLHSYRVLGNESHLKGKTGKNHPGSLPLFQYTMEGYFVKHWDSRRDVERELGIDGSGISKALNGVQQHAGGFIWKSEYLGEKIEVNLVKRDTLGKKNARSKPVLQVNDENHIIAEFENAPDVERKLGFNRRGICDACLTGKKYMGSYWYYKSDIF